MASSTGMKQRCWAHDYCAPSFYMVTIVTEPRRSCLSEVKMKMQGQGAAPATEPGQGAARATEPGQGAARATEPGQGATPGSVAGAAPVPAFLTLSPLGEIVLEVWRRTSSLYPGVEACECVAMPDHFHGILWVKKRLPRHVGHIIKAFKRVSEKECGSWGSSPHGTSKGLVLPPPPGSIVGAAPAPTSLWEKGYQDSILLRRGQLKAMANYIADNPRRLAIKRANPELFTVVRDLTVAPGRACPAFGNLFLLDYPLKREVQVSRSISADALADRTEELLYAAKHGAVLVSPCISPGEREIARAALNAGLRLIVILANGFGPLYKPAGRYFDACANGRPLMLAPLPYRREKTTITREQCLTLNGWAQDVVNDSDSKTDSD